MSCFNIINNIKFEICAGGQGKFANIIAALT